MLSKQPSQWLPLDRGNPLSNGIVYCLNTAISLDDQWNNQPLLTHTGTRSIQGYGQGVSWVGPDTGGVRFTVTRQPGYIGTTYTPHTIAAVIRPSSLFAGASYIACLGEIADNNYHTALGVNNAGAVVHSVDGTLATASSMGITTGATHVIGVSVRGAASRTMMANGFLSANTTSITGGACTSGIGIGSYWRNSTASVLQDFSGAIALVVVWNRALSDGELNEFGINPWQIFVDPAQSRMRIIRAARVSVSGYTLTAGQGTYSLTGQAAGLRAARNLAAAQGSYALTGQAAGVKRGLMLAAAQGAYTLTGQAAAIRLARKLVAAQGTYALTGQTAGLRIARNIAAAQGSYGLSGQDVALSYSGSGPKILSAAQGTYTLTGQGVSIVASRKMAAAQGVYALTGFSALLSVARRLAAAQGTYAVTGQAASLRATRTLALARGTYSLTGQNVTLTYSGALTSISAARTYLINAENRGYLIRAEARTLGIS